MINQIKPSDISNPNVFAPFKTKDGVDYAIVKPISAEQNQIQKEEKNKEKEHNSKALGISIASTALFIGFGVLALTKGLPKSWYTKLNTYFKSLEDKISKISENKNLSNLQSFYLKSLKFARSLTDKSKILFTSAAFKDVLMTKGLSKVPKGEKFSTWISNIFQKISVKTARSSYAKTFAKFDDMSTSFANAVKHMSKEELLKPKEINGEVKTVQEWFNIAQRDEQFVLNFLDKNFNGRARQGHLDRVNNFFDGVDESGKKVSKSLYQKVWDVTLGDLKTFVRAKRSYETFIPEELSAPMKIELGKEVNSARRLITNDITDNYNETSKILKNIDILLDPTDKASRDITKAIRENLDEYKKLSGSSEDTLRNALNEKIAKNLETLKTCVEKTNSYDSKSLSLVSGGIDDLLGVLKSSKKGKLQEILTIYKNILPDKEYLNVKKQTYKAIKSLDKSIDLETDKLFDKIRDLKLGSAPTDMLSILSSLGFIGWGLSKAENKDERTSVALKYGIPALGSVATSLYCTVRLVSGGASLIFGLVSGLVINKIGEALDNSIKKYKENPVDLKNIPTIVTNPVAYIDEIAKQNI